ncbi:MAG: tRNA 2-thiocytidine(32) synthetase TtcA [Erysipelotrichaceae bacterium]|nr:tRNA 2-thiocytidine(32) synthetase TtcA [Erysipelotrichaceae bacterium]MDY5251323.1 ATP-binding protein [Erysipelotrichaceae bacterium]
MSIKKLVGLIRKADKAYQMIEDGDRVAVGVSGGKDSMLLLYCLSKYQAVAKRFDNKEFEIVGIHLDMGFSNMDFQEVRDFCKKENIEYYDIKTRLYDILKLNNNEDNTLKCSLCSTFKKGAVIKEAKRLGCNKTAFAHHADDAIETLMMNMIYGGKIATFAPKMYLNDSEMMFIRPFIYAFESQLRQSIQEINIPVVKSTCPNDGFTKRQDIKELLQNIYHQYPSAKNNFLLALHNEKQLALWHEITENKEI